VTDSDVSRFPPFSTVFVDETENAAGVGVPRPFLVARLGEGAHDPPGPVA
jgi:hypothetical protein